MSDCEWRSPCQGSSISSFKLDSTTKSGIKIISNSDDGVERLKAKQNFNDLDFITIEEAAEMTSGTRVTFVPGMQAIYAEALKNVCFVKKIQILENLAIK